MATDDEVAQLHTELAQLRFSRDQVKAMYYDSVETNRELRDRIAKYHVRLARIEAEKHLLFSSAVSWYLDRKYDKLDGTADDLRDVVKAMLGKH